MQAFAFKLKTYCAATRRQASIVQRAQKGKETEATKRAEKAVAAAAAAEEREAAAAQLRDAEDDARKVGGMYSC